MKEWKIDKELQKKLVPLFRKIKDHLQESSIPEGNSISAMISKDGYISFFTLGNDNAFYLNYSEFNEKEGNIYGEEFGNQVSSGEVG